MTQKKFFTIIGGVLAILCFALAIQLYFLFAEKQGSDVFEEEILEIDMRSLEDQWTFEPNLIEVPLGSKVRLNIVNEDSYAHGFAINEFDVDAYLAPLRTTVVEFVADQKGEFEFFCSVVCGRGHSDQKGRLIVE